MDSDPLISSLLASAIPAPIQQAATVRGQRKYDELLGHALAIASRDGFSGLTLRELARCAKMRLSNVQHYFATSEGLLEATLEHLLATYVRRVAEISSTFPTSPERRLEAYLHYLLEDNTSPETNSLFFSLWDVAQRMEVANRVMDRMYTVHRKLIEEMVRCTLPVDQQSKAPLVAALIVAQIEGLMVLLAARRPRHDELIGLAEMSKEVMLTLAKGNTLSCSGGTRC